MIEQSNSSAFSSRQQHRAIIQTLIDAIPHRSQGIDCTGLQGAAKAYLLSKIYLTHRIPMVVVTPTEKQAKVLQDEIRFFLGELGTRVHYFPPYHLLPFKFLSPHNETAAGRIRSLYYLMAGDVPPVIVTPVTGLMKKIVPRQTLHDFAELIMQGEEIDREQLIAKLHCGGYEHAAIVEEPGDYCVRGGIVDIYSPLYQEPVRIEFFGDFVESMRFFSPVNQRTHQDIQEAIILPAKEAVLDNDRISRVVGRIREQASELNTPVTTVRKVIERVRNDGMFPGIENLMPLLYRNLETFFDYVKDDALFVISEHESMEAAALESQKLVQKNFDTCLAEGGFCVEPRKMYLNWTEVQDCLARTQPLAFKFLSMYDGEHESAATTAHFAFQMSDNAELASALRHPQTKENMLVPLIEWIKDKHDRGLFTALAGPFSSQLERLRGLLSPYGIDTESPVRFPESPMQEHHHRPKVFLFSGQISTGFVWPDASMAILTADEILGTKKRRKAESRSVDQRQLLTYSDLKAEDLVVHDDHGIGQYRGLVKLTVEDAVNDYLLITYKDNDKLYLPVERMNRIQKYMGVEGIIPVVDKMGGKFWDKVKTKAKKSAEKIAGELLKLYAARSVQQGFSHQAVDRELQAFENGFIYEETADQLKVIEEVLYDMAQPTPMDRLVCGDVGYGKTEVALRASFVAVYNGKQVAILVPTTVLAEQHFATFRVRFKNAPVNIACLSRFRTQSEQRQIVKALKEGRIDIVIGTHRILQKDVGFKDLGLFVIDEEQRFGVKHKERLKQIRTTVDVLALTATPIPRTLHMSLMGVRDIGLIATPPEYRHAIVTYVCEFADGIVKDAINKELRRKGQIFFVHNNINTIERMAARLQSIVPQVRLDIAHGRMSEADLEKVMQRFVNREIDMLVCTTIIESGLDIPSANTMFINRADRFGLAQMYQLRGRVGRAEEQAYAYLFIPPESYLTRDALKRLKVLMEHSDLGSGFQIAMNDLKIRGGGAILGASQSGHIAAVGYDMFLKLMQESVAELKGEDRIEQLEPEINVPLSAYIPEFYIGDIDQRLSVYRRLSRITAMDELSDIRDELMDRYGKLPPEAGNLFLKVMLKIMSIKAGVKQLDLNVKNISLHISAQHQQNPHGIVDWIMNHKDRFRLTPNQVLIAKLSDSGHSGPVTQAKNILKEMARHVNG
jgi:transcription-repair coupling factor (superfamily II helicase)